MAIWRKLTGRDPVAHALYVLDEVKSLQRIDETHHHPESPYGPSGDLHATTVRLLKDANFPSVEKFTRGTVLLFLEGCEKAGRAPPSDPIARQLLSVAAEIYALECIAPELVNETTLPNPAHYPNGIAAGQMRDHLLAQQQKAIHPVRTLEAIRDALLEAFAYFYRCLPPASLGLADFDDCQTIPLTEMLSDVGSVIEAVTEPFWADNEIGLFKLFRKQLGERVERLTQERRAKQPIAPSEYDEPPDEIVRAFLDTTPFRTLFDVQLPFHLPDEQRFSGHWIIAPPGRGKTTLLHWMVREDISDENACVILMDSKGDLTAPIRELKELEDRLIVIDPDPQHPVAINPLDIPKTDISLAVANLEYIFASLLEVKMTPNQTVLFRSVLRALITAFPNPTFETFRDIIQNGIEKYKEYIDKLPQDLQDFFYKEFNSKVYEGRRPEITWRIRLLLENDAMRGMLLAAKTRFNIGEAMDSGKIVIINNSKALLGDQGAEFFGRFFIAQVLAAAQQRGSRRPDQKPPVYFYIDECQNVIARDERISTILDECRSQKVALILAHQRTEQIKSADVLSALSNCAIRYANSDDEAQYLAPRLRTNKAFLETLPRGKFAVFVRDMTSQAIAISVPKTDYAAFPQFSPAQRDAFKRRMHSLYGTPAALQAPEISPDQRAAAEQLAKALVPVTEIVRNRLTLDEARTALAEAIKKQDWARAGELQHSIIPELEREFAATARPRPSPQEPVHPHPPRDPSKPSKEGW